jgi:hypothetical protein
VTTPAAHTASPPQQWSVAAEEPFIAEGRLPLRVDRSTLSRYGDRRWVLGPLQRDSQGSVSLNWLGFAEPLRESWRRAGWLLVNMPTPVELLDRVQATRVEWPSPTSMYTVVHYWRAFDQWLTGRGVTRLGDVDTDLLEDYAADVLARGSSESDAKGALYAVSRLWGMAPHLPPHMQIPMPPWEATSMRDYLPSGRDRNENTTEPIHPAVMSPLLIWAVRFVEDFADDIITAWDKHQLLASQLRNERNSDATAGLIAMLEFHADQGVPLPGVVRAGELQVAVTYLAATHQTSIRHVKNLMKRRSSRLTAVAGTSLGTPVNGLVHGRPWKPHIDFTEAAALMRMLSAACMIVLAYLTGLRPAEVLGLEVGCCPPPVDDGVGNVRYQLLGNFYKGARGVDGKLLQEGARRQIPWITIPPVARAVAVLERVATTSALFPAKDPWTIHRGRPDADRTGRFTTAETAGDRVMAFVGWVNRYAASQSLAAEQIPDDPAGSLSLSRYRRTVAWHIARLPGGRIALAIQYGHLRATQSDAYGALSRHGIRKVLDVETAMGIAQFLQDITDRLDDGEGISGPAATRMIKSARERAARFEGMYLADKDLKKLLLDPDFQVFDNPDALLTCNKDPDKALCDPDRGRRVPGPAVPPALERCNPGCANIARTDSHMRDAALEIEQLHAEADDPLTPWPLAERHRQRISALETTIKRHERTRVVINIKDVKVRHDEQR